jgi:hypothetical protein
MDALQSLITRASQEGYSIPRAEDDRKQGLSKTRRIYADNNYCAFARAE